MPPLITDRFLFCNDIYFMRYVAMQKHKGLIDAFNSTSSYAALFGCTAVVQASREALISRLKLDDCFWLDPPWFN